MSMNLDARIVAMDGQSRSERLALVQKIAPAAGEAIRKENLSVASADTLRKHLLELLKSDVGTGSERLAAGELLGLLGDPRLKSPSESEYWVSFAPPSGDDYSLGRFQVTNQEFHEFVDAGGYKAQEHWTDAGWAWLQGCDDPWHTLSSRDGSLPYLVPNQPVVGVTLHEAVAYASWRGARLPRWSERVFAVRGEEKRPYPWGSPFGEGNANTAEEVLGRPCAVGIYLHDRTPDGVYDMAGNAGEWTADNDGQEYLLHPGSWDQPSLAAWAKALTTEGPEARWGALGFRLARD